MEFYLAHIGINPITNKDNDELRFLLSDLLGMKETVETPLSWFIGDGKIELMKEEGYGSKGHLAFYTSDIEQTIQMLTANGVKFDMTTAKYNEDGSLRLVYIDHEINGFAIHLTTRK